METAIWENRPIAVSGMSFLKIVVFMMVSWKRGLRECSLSSLSQEIGTFAVTKNYNYILRQQLKCLILFWVFETS